MNRDIYWEEKGKFQEEANKLNGLIPNMGMTDNPYLNVFINASRVYYDVYNNGAFNLKDCFLEDFTESVQILKDDIKTFKVTSKEETIYKNLKNKEKLEKIMDEIICILKDKDLSYNKYTIYCNFKEGLLSKEPKEGFDSISFGLKKDYEDWINDRILRMNFKML